MTGFADDLRRFTAMTERRMLDVHAATVVLAHQSITIGSVITGAPGQPVDLGNLRNSVQIEHESPTRALISTNVEYAEAVEDAVGPYGPRVYGAKNGIGGSHSLKQTMAGGQALVDEAVRLVGWGR